MPVSYFTGLPSISIPLYEFNIKGISLPIKLEYDASGVMPNSLPSIAGQNWTLNAGGVITRTVRGRYDEWVYPRQADLPNARSYFQEHDRLKSLLSQNDNYKNLKNTVMWSNYDLAPDIFHFSFLGMSGTFFMDETGSWQVQSDDNLEVIFDCSDQRNFTSPFISRYPKKTAIDPNQPKTIYGFVIRDTNGNTYQFGYTENSIEYTTNIWHMSESEDNESWHAMSWFLTKVLDRYGNTVYSLDYERGHYIMQVFNSYYYYEVKEKVSGVLGAYFSYTAHNSHFPYTISLSSPVYLTNITTSSNIKAEIHTTTPYEQMKTENMYGSFYTSMGGVHPCYTRMAQMVPLMYGNVNDGAFYYLQTKDETLKKYRYTPNNEDMLDLLSHTRIRRLSHIAIRPINAMNSKACVGFNFYMNCNNNRMRLDSIVKRGSSVFHASNADKDIDGVYRFKYNKFEKIPSDYLTTEVDHWGYYNGRPYAENGKPADNIYDIREPDTACTKIGVLNEIQYPTGGVCRFEYEQNTYGKALSADRQQLATRNGVCGGLRIKSMKLYESSRHDKLLQERDFSYNKVGSDISSGELFATPIYKWDNWKLKCEQSNATYHLSTLQTSSIVPLVNGSGVSIGYSRVTETVKDLSQPDKSIKKTVYRYTNLSDARTRDQKFTLTFGYEDSVTPFDEFSELGFMRGRPLSEEVYDGDGKKIESTAFGYRSDNFLQNHYVLTSNLLYECSGNSAQYAHYTGGVYKIYYPKYDIVSRHDTIWNYNSSTPIVTSVSYKRHDADYVSEYRYRHNMYLRLLDCETSYRGQDSEECRYNYGCFNCIGNKNILYHNMFYIAPLSVDCFRNQYRIYTKEQKYAEKTINGETRLVPSMLLRTNAKNMTDTIVKCMSYTNTGALACYKQTGQHEKHLKWALNDNFLMLIGDNGASVNFYDSDLFDQTGCLDKVKKFIQTHSGSYTGYTYNPMFGVTNVVSPNLKVTRYSYDDFGRLSGIWNTDNKLKESFTYKKRR